MAEFRDLVAIVRGLGGREFSEGRITGIVHIDSSEDLHRLKVCVENFDDTAVELVDPISINTVIVPSHAKVSIGTPRPGFGLISNRFDDFLLFPGTHIKEPKHYFIIDLDFSRDDGSMLAGVITSYRAVLKFVDMLKVCSAFLDEHEELMVFINSGRFDFPINYTKNDLDVADPGALEELATAIPHDVHEKQCRSIMAEAVFELTSKQPSNLRFPWLLHNLKELKTRFDQGYQLFAAGFSYEKIRDEIEAAAIDYSGKIHKIFADIQNQLLGIPLATVVVATQMKETAGVDASFWLNVAILAGSFGFSLLMLMLIRNQRQTLEVIGIEIRRQKSKLEKEHAAVAANFVTTFSSLDARYQAQRRILSVVDLIVAIGFLMSVAFFIKLDLHALAWIRTH